MQIESQVGPQIQSDGSQSSIRLGRTGEQIATELHGKYYEQSVRGSVFWATMTAGVIFPAPANTTNNPITLANPAGSGKNISLISFDMEITTINSGAIGTGAYGLYVNSNVVAAAVSGTVLTPISGTVGSNYLPSAKVFTTSTIPAAPTIFKPYGFKLVGGVAAAVPITGLPSFHIDFDGTAILSPGASITPQISVADATSNPTVICSFCWEELTT